MILVTGATGSVGRGLARELAAQGTPARMITRDAEKAKALEEQGFEVVVGDLERGEDVDRSLKGVESLFLLTSQQPRQAELQGSVVDAAKRAGVKRIVKVSGGSAVNAKESGSWVGRAHWETEQEIKDAGLNYTFLRPNYFMQNLLMLAEPIRNGVLPVPLGDARTAMIDARDVGAVAARILATDGQHDGQVYDLTGAESLGFADVAVRLSRGLGREVRYVDPPLEAAVETMRGRGAPDWLVEHFQQVMTVFRSGAGAETTPTVEEVLGRPPRTLDEFIADHAEAFA